MSTGWVARILDPSISEVNGFALIVEALPAAEVNTLGSTEDLYPFGGSRDDRAARQAYSPAA